MSRNRGASNVDFIDVGPSQPRRRRWRRWVVAGVIVLFIVLSRTLGIYISALWFGSLGYSSVYWYIFKLKTGLFFAFALLTGLILRVAFLLLERGFSVYALEKRTIVVNNQPVQFSPARFTRPVAWVVTIIAALINGFAMKSDWKAFGLYFKQPFTGLPDPIFGKPLGFYLFSLPVYDSLTSWLTALAFIILCAALLYSLLALPQKVMKASVLSGGAAITAVSLALALFLLLLATKTYLARYPFLWQDHQTFTGVTYAEANYVIPALVLVSIALVISALIAMVNAFTQRKLRLLLLALALPLITYILGVIAVPAYVTSFIVKPNELDRESPYIEHNIGWTRRAFGLEGIELRDFEAENSVEALNLQANQPTLENIRLWDWQALRDTLKQIQAIRTYYDFSDVDVDRYKLNGQMRQMMVAPREIAIDRLPAQSRNWINERLIYTHGYGLTMNTANGFTPEGMPVFVISDMPIRSTSEIQVKRPQIYYGEETNTFVYGKTRQKEFDYPQGDANTYTTYEGNGGIRIGSTLRRILLAWALGDLSKLPFSDDVTPESRALIHRNIRDIANGVAPFLTYDDDPYLVVTNDGKLVWMLDAFTESDTYPYSAHHRVGDNEINYIRNSVKVAIDAYDGTVRFYVFDSKDPLINAYRAMFPALFQDASQMPVDLRAHVRYPETLIRAQGEIYGLYHTQNTKAFFQREDVWSIAQQVGFDPQGKKQTQQIDPYYVLMQLPGEQEKLEFLIFLPFTPGNRNNMIGWMAGRCDGEHYGKLLVYNFPKSRLIDGPLQLEARIDQNAQLSAQFTLWNQQGSHVIRGHLLVIPVGRSLLYVEPVYLQAVQSPMPELRLVVLATQERLGFGQTFQEAMVNLFGEAAGRAPAAEKPTTGEKPAEGQPKPSPTPVAGETLPQLVNRAIQEFDDYQKLTAQGKLAEAGQKLEQHKRTLEEIKRLSRP
ncbi:MAG: membrane protein [Acidobacteria bacterium]|nr:MAG: membrane protein [Acidobacteriota bacterium]